MNKLISTLLIISVLVVSGCIQGGQETSNHSTETEPKPNNTVQSTDIGFQKNVSVGFTSSGLTSKEAAEKLKEKHGLPGEMKSGGFGIRWDDNLGIPQSVIAFRSDKYLGEPQDAATAFLQEYGDLIKLENNSLFLSDVWKVGDEARVVYEQRYKGTPFYNGGQVQVLVTADNRVRQLSVDYFPGAKFSEAPAAEQSSIDNTLKEYLTGIGVTGSELVDLVNYLKPERIIYPLDYSVTQNTKFRLTWLYRIPNGRLFIDASTAEIVGEERI